MIAPFNCLNPKRITSPYTGEVMFVPCGKCKACTLHKNSRLAFQCDLEEQAHKYCVFITLTYANRFIPRMSFRKTVIDQFPCFEFYDKETGEAFGSLKLYQDYMDDILKKVYLFGDVPYLRKTDLQLFFKRLRKYYAKITDDKIRYFACGEYGPEHFRPHFHILLYFDDKRILQVLEQALLSCWKFGRVDASLSRGGCSSYVSSYVNSTCTLPEVFTLSATRPFSCHSRFLGQSILQKEREEVYKTPVDEFIRRSAQRNGSIVKFNLWRSCYNAFYPKCKGYARFSSRERLYCYRTYFAAKKAFEGETPIELAREIATYIHVFKDFQVIDGNDHDREMTRFTTFMANLCDFASVRDYDRDSIQFERFVSRIYNVLLTSRHFLVFCCNTFSLSDSKVMLKRIEDFYSRLDYLHLVDFYENQSEYFESEYAMEDDVILFYDNCNSTERIKSSYVYGLYNSEISRKFEDRIKHKKQNDANKMFIYDEFCKDKINV